MRTRSSGANVTATVRPPWPRARASVAIDTREATSATSRRRERTSATSSPSARCAPRKTLKNGTAIARTEDSAHQPRPSPSVARDNAISAPRARARAGTTGFASASERSRFPRSRSDHQCACGLSANAKEKSVATSVQPARVTPTCDRPRRAAAARTASSNAMAKTVTSNREMESYGSIAAQRSA
ncbi:MAG: hypothetical protein DMF77_17795, partial [Acidobacteria bacterium]